MGLDLIFAEQESDALDVAVDGFVLEPKHGGKIERRRADLDAHPAEGMTGLVESLGRMQHRLRRNAADIEAGAAERFFLLDDGNLHAELCGANRADIAGWAGTDDDKIVGGHLGPWTCQLTIVLAALCISCRNLRRL